MDYTVFTRANWVNVRSGPGLKYRVIGKIAHRKTAVVDQRGEVNGWYPVSIQSGSGFISSAHVRLWKNNVISPAQMRSPGAGDGWDNPVGPDPHDARVWADAWYDASPFAQLYLANTPHRAYHTGADLNWWRDDTGLPVYCPAHGIVRHVQHRVNAWGSLVVIEHFPYKDMVLCTRYAHMRRITVKPGQIVLRNEQIGEIANLGNSTAPHLHFDVAYGTLLVDRPHDWPKMNLARLRGLYTDPRQFISANRPKDY